jgi:hypothetical protein
MYKVLDDKTYHEAKELQEQENPNWEPTPAEKQATENWRNEYLDINRARHRLTRAKPVASE